MPRRKPVRPSPAFDQELTKPTDQEPKPITEDDELEDVFADFPQNDSCIELWRTTAQGGRPEFIEQMTPSAFSFAYVTDTYGGGRYVAKGKYQNGDVEKRSFTVAGDPFPVRRKLEKPLIESLDHPRQTTTAAPTATVTLPEGAGANEVILVVMNMFQKMITEMRGSKTEWLQELKEMREIFGVGDKPAGPQAQVQELIGMIKTGIELGQASGEGGGGGFPWMMAFDKFQAPLTKLADTVYMAVAGAKGNTVANVPVQPVPAGAAPIQSATVEAAQPEPKKEENMILTAFKSLLPMLLTGAAKNSEPALYVDFLLDQIPGPFYDKARTWLMEPDCLEQLAKVEPGIRFQQEWWSSLRNGLIEALDEELGHAPRTLQPEPNTNASADRSAPL